MTVAAVCGLSVGLATAALAAVPQADPPGANGTVQIDGAPLAQRMGNEPHVPCDFAVDFHNFDDDEHANIVFTIHPPSSASGPGTEILRLDNVLVSDDPAGGANPDPDEVFEFNSSQLGLDAFTPHPQQGFHVKLTVERIGPPGAGKHKVFWVLPCEAPTTPGTPPGSESPTAPGSESSSPGEGGGLPVTGGDLGGMVAAGLGMIAAGTAAVLVARRRRSMSEAAEG